MEKLDWNYIVDFELSSDGKEFQKNAPRVAKSEEDNEIDGPPRGRFHRMPAQVEGVCAATVCTEESC